MICWPLIWVCVLLSISIHDYFSHRHLLLNFNKLNSDFRDTLDTTLQELKSLTVKLQKNDVYEPMCEYSFNTLLYIIPGISFILDTDGNFDLITNVDILGWKSEDLIGKHFSKIIHTDYVNEIKRENVLLKYKNTSPTEQPKIFDERRTSPRITQNLHIQLLHKNTKEIEDADMYIYGLVTSSGRWFGDINSDDKEFIGSIGIIEIKQNINQD